MCSVKFIVHVFVLINIHSSLQCPMHDLIEAKAAYKSGDTQEQTTPITISQIKLKLKESGIFDENSASLNEREKKELRKLFDVVEIMTRSRNRQPQNVQNMFTTLRMMERVVKKQTIFRLLKSLRFVPPGTNLRDFSRQVSLGEIVKSSKAANQRVPLRQNDKHESI